MLQDGSRDARSERIGGLREAIARIEGDAPARFGDARPARSRVALGIDLAGHIARGQLRVHQVDPAELSPGEFAARVQRVVERGGVRLLVIDSLNGYLAAMP